MNSKFYLFAKPSLLTGTARLVDLGGVFDKYNRSRSEAEADARALASDWSAISQDLEIVMNRTAKELVRAR